MQLEMELKAGKRGKKKSTLESPPKKLITDSTEVLYSNSRVALGTYHLSVIHFTLELLSKADFCTSRMLLPVTVHATTNQELREL